MTNDDALKPIRHRSTRAREVLGSPTVTVLIAIIFLCVPTGVHVVRAARNDHLNPDSARAQYMRAVAQAVKESSLTSHERDLETLPSGKPVTLVTWKRRSQVDDYRHGSAPKDTWVTVAPRLQDFCRKYVRENRPRNTQLILRLEQRLGLPPNSGYESFVEVRTDPANCFRPCGDQKTNTRRCVSPQPIKPNDLAAQLESLQPGNSGKTTRDLITQRYWFLNQFYGSFANSAPYPWTGLGYTFDWAPRGSDDGFVTVGESEFVIREGALIEFVSEASTREYCGLR